MSTKELRGIVSYTKFAGRWELKHPHECGSCDLDDYERATIKGRRLGIKDCLPIMEEMEQRILELEARNEQ